jgi:hypothetical protein
MITAAPKQAPAATLAIFGVMVRGVDAQQLVGDRVGLTTLVADVRCAPRDRRLPSTAAQIDR